MSSIVEKLGSRVGDLLLRGLMEAPLRRRHNRWTVKDTEDLIREARRTFVEELHLYDEGYAKFQLRPPYNLENFPEAAKRYLFPDNPECSEPIDIEAEAHGQDTNRTTLLKMKTKRVGPLKIQTDTDGHGYFAPPYPLRLHVTYEPDLGSPNPFNGMSKLALAEMAHNSTEFVLEELHKLQNG